MLIQDEDDCIFGAFQEVAWKHDIKFYGDSRNFIFQFHIVSLSQLKQKNLQLTQTSDNIEQES